MADRSFVKDRILKMLGNGLTANVVAQAVGCDPSYISQLMAEEDFALEVAKLRCASVEQDIGRDNKYDELEDRLLEKLEDLLPFIMKPRDVLDALTRINAAKRRATVGRGDSVDGHTTIINLVLPQTVVSRFQLSADSEVVQVGERPLVNLPAGELMKSLGYGGENASEEPKQPQFNRISAKKGGATYLTEDSV